MKNILKSPQSIIFIQIVIISLLVIVLLVILATYPRTSKPDIRWISWAKSNLHTLQIALDRYGEDNGGKYPSDVNDLIYSDFLLLFPENPWTEQPMCNIPFGVSPSKGEFTYIPYSTDCEVTGYYIICYGPKDAVNSNYWDLNGDGEDDNVILILTSDNIQMPDESNDDPWLQDYLNSSGNAASMQSP